MMKFVGEFIFALHYSLTREKFKHFEITFLLKRLSSRSRSYWSAARTHSLIVNASILVGKGDKQHLRTRQNVRNA